MVEGAACGGGGIKGSRGGCHWVEGRGGVESVVGDDFPRSATEYIPREKKKEKKIENYPFGTMVLI